MIKMKIREKKVNKVSEDEFSKEVRRLHSPSKQMRYS